MSESRKTPQQVAEEALPCVCDTTQKLFNLKPLTVVDQHYTVCPFWHREVIAAAIAARDR